ncbi:MAG: ATP synthase F1 subunit delta [Bacteroidales bacterium]|nr:ATP synthase F1 subunit delta [Bacteroidales bacterium]
MITAKRVDVRYATALLRIAKERGIEKAVYNDMLELRVLTVNNVDFKNFLKSPTIKNSQKAHILKLLFTDAFNPLTLDFLLLILKKARVGNIMNIATAYVRMYRIENHLKTVTVYTEKELFDPQKQQLETTLKSQIPGETIELRCRTHPGLIGGLVLRYDDYLFNGSISRQLKNFRLNLQFNHYETQF